MGGLKLLSLWPEELFDHILSDLGWQSKSAPLHDLDLDLLGLFERRIFLPHWWHGRFSFESENDGICIIGKYRVEE